MKMRILASASIAATLAVTMVDATPADAAERKLMVRKVQKPSVVKTAPKQSHALRHMKRVQKIEKKPVFTRRSTPSSRSHQKGHAQAALRSRRAISPVLLSGGGSHLKLGKAGKLPVFKPVMATAALKGRVGVPMQNFKPKLTLMKAPKAQFAHKLSPFVQRHWKKAFFWVAVAGIGYMTIPELYYDRFVTYVEADDYDGCIRLLSYAAVEEEDEIVRVRKPMPQNASYRFAAKTAPEPANFCRRRLGLQVRSVRRAQLGPALRVGADPQGRQRHGARGLLRPVRRPCQRRAVGLHLGLQRAERGGGHGHGCHDKPDRSRSGHAVTPERFVQPSTASAPRPMPPTMMRHQANGAKPCRLTNPRR